MEIKIKVVKNQRDLKKFITFPEQLYKGNKYWVPSLLSDELFTLSKILNPAFKHCQAEYFLAYKGDEIVGRVAGIINNNANEDWNLKTVRFGWIDFIDDIEVTKALINAVCQWGKEKGMTELRGPLGFSDMDKEGLLIEGFCRLPSITTIYNFPYYAEHFEKLGLKKDVDWVQNTFILPDVVPEKLHHYSNVIMERYGLKLYRPKSTKELKKRGHEIFTVFNVAYSSLYEFTRLNQAQIRTYVNQYLPMINKDLICLITDKNDKIVAFAITMPSMSIAMKKAKGRIFPLGFWHLLRALRKMDTLELLLIGIMPEYHNKGLNSIIFDYLHSNSIKYGVKQVISNPQLEHNTAVQSLFYHYPTEPYQRRRAYEAKLEDIMDK